MKKYRNLTNETHTHPFSAKKIALAILSIMIFVLFSQGVDALVWNNNTFNNSLTQERLTFTPSQNITRFLNIPQAVSFITTAFMDIIGFLGGAPPQNLIAQWDFTTNISVDTSGNFNWTFVNSSQVNLTSRGIVGDGLFYNASIGLGMQHITNNASLRTGGNGTWTFWLNVTE